jgi:hypothetical protein
MSNSPKELASSLSKMARTERIIFRACLAYAIASTLIWLFFIITQRDGGVFFKGYNIEVESIRNILVAFLVFWCFWSYLIYILKAFLLKRIGVTKEDRKVIFSTRENVFDLQAILTRYPERKIRIIDMVGRRLRAAIALLVSFFILAAEIRKNPGPDSLAFGIQSGFLESIFLTWWTILSYLSSGVVGHIAYGAQARIMDGKLGRANALLIGTLWGLFKFIMIPIGIQMSGIFPKDTYATLFVFIWVSYLLSDTMGEIVGSIFGKQTIKVVGVGEVNRKSVIGTWAVFLSSMICCTYIVIAHGHPPIWFLVGLIISISNTFLELYSPRGTDDFTMATSNAIICLMFGLIYYA